MSPIELETKKLDGGFMINEALKTVVEGRDLTRDDAVAAMNRIMSGGATDAQIAALITALRMKGESVDEISGFAEVMRAKATEINPKTTVVVDTCGTGGDLSGTFNISTTAAFVVAGAGVAVAKHGNRSVSSSCGSADLLEALGVNLGVDPQTVADSIDTIGIGFLYAPALHAAMKFAIGPRKEIGIRTVFNILGPLTNPARARYQVLGVYAPELTDTLAEVLGSLGTQHALVVHGDGLDEITTTGVTKVSEIKNGQATSYDLTPEEMGVGVATSAELAGGSIEKNVQITTSVLAGEPGAARDIVLVNAAAALVVADRAADIPEGVNVAADSIDSGRALSALKNLVELTNRS